MFEGSGEAHDDRPDIVFGVASQRAGNPAHDGDLRSKSPLGWATPTPSKRRRHSAGPRRRYRLPRSPHETVLASSPPWAAPARGLRRAPDPSAPTAGAPPPRSEEHTSELQSRGHLVCRLLLEKKKK